MSHETDEEIAVRVQQGNVEAFGVLMERYVEKLTRYARRFLFEGDDTKDIVQEVFIKAYTNIRGFDQSRRFSPWIYRIAHNELINALRSRSRFPSLSIDSDTVFPHLVAEETADRDASRRELQEALERFLGKLDPKYREPLVLYYFEDMDYKEIAEILQTPVSTVGVRLTRGKAMLKKQMESRS